jgi:KipI family sensor histidine kinase inhibitor
MPVLLNGMTKISQSGERFVPASDQTLLIYFGESISQEAHELVVRFLRLLEREPLRNVRNVHPAYCSVLVKFDALRWTHAELEAALRERISRLGSVPLPAARVVEIPACYEKAYAPDMAEICARRGWSAERVIALHTATSYQVYFLGFVPGFAYLGELPEELAEARLATPRRAVPAGSVAIAGRQTAVYPFATPGGWRLIGRTPMRMFRAEDGGSSVLAIGDRVQFRAISAEEFLELEKTCR